MLANYLLTLYRALTRHRLYAALNVLGLAVGIALFLVLFLLVRHETTYDRWLTGANDVYRLTFVQRPPEEAPLRTAVTPGVVAPLLRQDYPAIRAATRMMPIGATAHVGARAVHVSPTLVDPDFGRVFPLPVLSGSLGALADPASAVLSESMARKLFGTDQALGRTLALTVEGRSYDFRVGAVTRSLPSETVLEGLDLLVPMRPELTTGTDRALTDWSQSSMLTWVRVDRPEDAAAINADFLHFIERRGDPHALGEHPSRFLSAELQPLLSLHYDVRTRGMRQPGVDIAVVTAMGFLGLAALLLASVNAVNLATARASLRAREVAIRKVHGATQGMLLRQFMAEALLTTFVAAMIGLALLELALPGLNALFGASMKLNYLGRDSIVGVVGVVVLVVALAAGGYPALVLARFQPAAVLAATRSPGGGRMSARLRAGLVALQFTVSIALIACTAVVVAQTRFEQSTDLGFQRSGLIQIAGGDATAFAPRRGAFLDALRATPGVTAVAVTDRGPANENATTSNAARPGHKGPDSMFVIETVAGDYLNGYGARLLAGRWFDPQRGLDDRRGLSNTELQSRGLNVVLNSAAARVLGFRSAQAATGQPVRVGGRIPATVAGVVHDLRFLGPRAIVQPTIYEFDSAFARGAPTPDWRVVARYQGVDAQTMVRRIEAVARRIAPVEAPLQVETVGSAFRPYYRGDERLSHIFTLGAVLAVLIGCLGLYGLASFNTARRTKEIGIRKTLGASTVDVTRLLVGQFLRPVLLANLLAWPIAYLAMRAWLSGFDQRIGLSPLYFLAATLGALAIAALTVIGQTLKVARAEPARALRYE